MGHMTKRMIVGALLALGANASFAGALTTVWGEKIDETNAWREYPRPQMVRANWTNLNGWWDYAITTNTPNGIVKEAQKGRILVPFAFESPLSGVGRLIGPAERMIYRKTLTLDPKPGRRILLNFEAVDYSTQVFLNGEEVTDVPHEGGCLPFSVDLTPFAKKGANALEVRVWDPTESQYGGRGKQSFNPSGCFYTRVSGIWQTVWLEEVPEAYIKDYKVVADIDKSEVRLEVKVEGEGEQRMKISAFDPHGKKVGDFTPLSTSTFSLHLNGFACWSPEHPNLYTFVATFGEDRIEGYFAMRKFATAEDRNGDRRFTLNNEFYFPLGTLDQGWWPDGLLTPPSEAAMEHDIKTLKACGFNMMRKHIKVEPRRYYALCDKLGILVWQDLPSGFRDRAYEDQDFARLRYGFSRQELKGMIDHLQKVPSIVTWVPYNEGWGQPGADLTRETLRWTRRYDPTRLVNGPSGWNDWEGGKYWKRTMHDWKGGYQTAPTCLDADGKSSSDIVDFHSYPGPAMPGAGGGRVSFLGEFGGLGLKVSGHLWNETNAWGYADTGKVTDRTENQNHYLELWTKVADLATHGLAGAVYTQTTDVELEINGLMTYDRKVLKYDAPALKAAHDQVVKTALATAAKGWLFETKAFAGGKAKVALANPGKYHLWVRTAAGQPSDQPVRVMVNGREVGAYGESCREAVWHDCGDIDITTMPTEIALVGDQATARVTDVFFNPGGDPTRPPRDAENEAVWRRPLLGLK